MAANDDVVSCNKNFTFKELLIGAIGRDASGKATLRLHSSASVNDSSIESCTNKDVTEEEAIMSLFALDTNGDISLRVSIL